MAGVEPRNVVDGFAAARAILRHPDARQAGFLASLVARVSLTNVPILYLHGADHRRQRGATARFFAPRTVNTSYRALMVRTSDHLIADFRRAGRVDLGAMSLRMAVTVAAEIVGLTQSDRDGMARRLGALMDGIADAGSLPRRIVDFARRQIRVMKFMRRDVKPAIRARRLARRDDVISHLLDEGYGDREILTECLTYGAAGMVTTREFITMAAWHLLTREELRMRFLTGDEDGRIAILEEILRLEPVVGILYRRMAQGEGGDGRTAQGDIVALDLRGANGDAAMVGACPHRLDPDRVLSGKTGRAGLAFGDGEHRCPGAQVALLETAIFLDQLLRVPGIRLERAPEVGWNGLVASYELRGATITCDGVNA